MGIKRQEFYRPVEEIRGNRAYQSSIVVNFLHFRVSPSIPNSRVYPAYISRRIMHPPRNAAYIQIFISGIEGAYLIYLIFLPPQ